MIYITLNCSSPFVGYSEKSVDLEKKELVVSTEKYLTMEGERLFNSSGSKYLLATFQGRRYFHARNLGVKVFDEQNRRIYTNIAFVGETVEEKETIDKMAVYAMLQEQQFYTEFSKLIVLERLGYTVKFDEMKQFLNRFCQNFSIVERSGKAERLMEAIYSRDEERIKVVVLEGNWSYLIRQSGLDLLKKPIIQFGNEEFSHFIQGLKVEIREEPAMALSQELNPTQIEREELYEEDISKEIEIKQDEILQNEGTEVSEKVLSFQEKTMEVKEEFSVFKDKMDNVTNEVQCLLNKLQRDNKIVIVLLVLNSILLLLLIYTGYFN